MTTTQTGLNPQGRTTTTPGGTSAADKAKGEAKAIATAVEGRAEQEFESVKEEAASRADSVASAVDTLARELQENDEAWLGDKAAALAAMLRRTGQNVQERRVDELADDMRQWSKNPALFLGGAFAIGLVAGRFLKSSARPLDSHAGQGTGLDEPSYEVTI